MKKIILSIFAIMSTLGVSADGTTTQIDVIRIYSSERTDDASTTVDESTFPVAEYQNINGVKYSAQLLNGKITIYKDAVATSDVFENSTDVKYRAELQKIKVTTDGESNGNQYVNLGLSSGALWAKTNVGSTTEFGYGGYYAWGETTACNAVPKAYPTSTSMDWTGEKSIKYQNFVDNSTIKETCLFENYKWCSVVANEYNASSNTLCKYISSSYFTLEDADDAATANWGDSWTMPTQTQMIELLSGTNYYWLNLNGINGYRFVKKDDVTRYVFLPAASMAAQSGIDTEYVGSIGCYWAKDLDNTYQAHMLYFTPYYTDGEEKDTRVQGCSIRPVFTKSLAEVKVLDSKFSVSTTKQIQFTKGNLYWDGNAYELEASQTDHPTSWDANHVGHFFWVNTADYQNSGQEPYAKDYLYNYGSRTADDEFFIGESNMAKMTVAGVRGAYYALSNDEWTYLLQYRTMTHGAAQYMSTMKEQGTVGTPYAEKGLFIYPDDYNGHLDEATWAEIESAGIVFIPNAGYRTTSMYGSTEITEVITEGTGYYWTATPKDISGAYKLWFSDYDKYAIPGSQSYRSAGYPIRLVKTASE